jgi:hypothetical protein
MWNGNVSLRELIPGPGRPMGREPHRRPAVPSRPRSLWLPDPGERTGSNDRLVPRFTTSGTLHVHLRLGRRANLEINPLTVEVSDISITGLLLRVTGSLRLREGAHLTLGDAGSTAVGRVVHARATPDGHHQWLGVEIVEQTPRFREELSAAVGALRKDRGQLLEHWERSD